MTEYLPVAVLVFGLVLVSLELILLAKSNVIASDKSVHLIGVSLVVVASLFIVADGVPTDATAAVVGLLGTVLGYVAGKKFDGEGEQK